MITRPIQDSEQRIQNGELSLQLAQGVANPQKKSKAINKPAPAGHQVSLLTLMVGNLAEKSLALAAILTATWRATAL